MRTQLMRGKSDDIIQLRNGMEMVLREGVKRGNLGETDYLVNALKRIQTYDNYKVQNVLLDKDTLINGRMYGKGFQFTVVKEGDGVLFVIYEDRTDFITKLIVNPYNLMCNHELKDMEKAEMKAILMKGEWDFQYAELAKRVDRIANMFDAQYM